MATFEELRPAKMAEFEYFKPERVKLEMLESDSLYVAMFALGNKVANQFAVAIPLQTASIAENDIAFRVFFDPSTLDTDVYKFAKKGDDFVDSKDDLLRGCQPQLGYIRDHNPHADGQKPEISIEEELRINHPELIVSGS